MARARGAGGQRRVHVEARALALPGGRYTARTGVHRCKATLRWSMERVCEFCIFLYDFVYFCVHLLLLCVNLYFYIVSKQQPNKQNSIKE